MNLIESLLAYMECELGETWGRIDNIELMKAALKTVWNRIPVTYMEDLIKSMPDRLQAVIDASERATQY